MWASLIIFHSNNFNRFRGSVEGLVDWHTCMRSVYIGDQRLTSVSAYYSLSDYEVYTGYKAYSVLLEIVSGIRSKLFGESEIQFQFNNRFSKNNLSNSPFTESLIKLKNQILEHVKQIRSEFIKGKGRTTYGGIADSILPGDSSVAILGTGQLSESIIFDLLKKNRKITVVGRNTKRLDFFKDKFNVITFNYSSFEPNSYSIIIANPHVPSDLYEKLSENSIVLDFRGEENNRAGFFSTKIKYYSFEYILNKVKESKEREDFLKPIIFERILELTQERENQVIQYPNGWEDINWIN
jgi:glutamyl-tRNA reductase